MKFSINNQWGLSRPPEGPLAPHIGLFAIFVDEQGYCPWSLKRHVQLAIGFSLWLKRRRIGLDSLCADHPVQYLRHRARHLRTNRADLPALRHLIDFLRQQGAISCEKLPTPRPSPIGHCLQSYEQYLRDARALANATIVNYVPFIRDFLKDCFGEGRVVLSRLRAEDVVRFVQRQAPRLHLKRAKLLTTALRSFLRYGCYCGDIVLDLAAAVPIVANWSMTSIPRAIPQDQVRQLLASIDRHTAVGRRDYAILLLLARLGLRSSEVVFLELDDIDWNTGNFSVHGKAGQRSDLPLSTEVGEAIACYLQHGRPKSTCRRVFLRTKAPIDGLRGPSSLGAIVRHSLERAGINAPTKGAHQFRHGLATDMLNQGASLGEIGELLGHRHPQTTTIYAKVDIKALRTLALPWPGGVR